MPDQSDTSKVFMEKDTGKVRIASSKKTTKPVPGTDEEDTVIPIQPEPLVPESGEFECFSVERSYPDHLSDTVVQAQEAASKDVQESFEGTNKSLGNFTESLKRFMGLRRKKKSEGKDHAESNGADSTPNLGVVS